MGIGGIGRAWLSISFNSANSFGLSFTEGTSGDSAPVQQQSPRSRLNSALVACATYWANSACFFSNPLQCSACSFVRRSAFIAAQSSSNCSRSLTQPVGSSEVSARSMRIRRLFISWAVGLEIFENRFHGKIVVFVSSISVFRTVVFHLPRSAIFWWSRSECEDCRNHRYSRS